MIIGITGTTAAGKDTMGEYLVSEKGFAHHSLSDIVRIETGNRGLEQNRDNWIKIGNEIREEFGPGELSRRLLKLIQDNHEENTVVTSIRTPGEIEIFKDSDMNFNLISVDAPIEIRYERAKKRNNEADKVDFEKFVEQEQKEMMSDNQSGQQIAACMAMADETIMNDGSFEDFKRQIDELLDRINES